MFCYDSYVYCTSRRVEITLQFHFLPDQGHRQPLSTTPPLNNGTNSSTTDEMIWTCSAYQRSRHAHIPSLPNASTTCLYLDCNAPAAYFLNCFFNNLLNFTPPNAFPRPSFRLAPAILHFSAQPSPSRIFFLPSPSAHPRARLILKEGHYGYTPVQFLRRSDVRIVHGFTPCPL